jgi:glycosyltransferase involved in cell wall biosynthesis
MNSLPLLSIITPCLNRAAFIRRAVESVQQQDYPHVEHLIQDGGSTDGTLALLASYPHLGVNSQPDRGVYDALNKGIAASRGEIIGQLNTDDYYQPGIFQKIMDIFQDNPNVDAVCGSARVFEVDAEKGEQDIALYGPIDNRNLSVRITTGVPIFNAWFFRRRVFEKIGTYSLDYPLVADRDFLIRFYLEDLKVLPAEPVFYNYCLHPGSLTINANYSVSLLGDSLRLSRAYLAKKNLEPVLRNHCLDWHDDSSIEMLIWHARNGDMKGGIDTVRNALRFNPRWLFLVLGQSPSRIIHYVRKHYGSNG